MMRKIAISILIILPFILFAFDKSNVSINPVYRTSQRLGVDLVSGAVKICALRVSFPEDDNDATTGNGKFLLRSDTGDSLCSPIVIDPPPHNKAYFRDHIRAAANYFYHVSKGHAVIDTIKSEVYPLIDSLTFQVSHKMDYYHPFLQEDSIDVRFARLFRESVLKADSAGVDFSQYDIVIIFHAGVGQDFDLFLDPTPYDIPSAYLNLNDFRMAFAPDNPNYEGIAVENSSYFIKEGIILPETQNHLLFHNWEDVFGGASIPCDYQIGLNGTFAFMMGFYWGLPSLYDTETGETGIGKFGLMDQGSANLNGLVPVVPSAWSRVFLGWEDPVVAGVDQIINLRHVETSSDSLVWKVPIDDYEYFLIENRYASIRPGVSLDSIQYRIYLENGEDEWPSIFPLIVDSIGAVFSEETGVLLSVSRYDVGLPGSGLLIWHIDESVIDANLSANRINVNRERRGVDLEEGDGAQDLGYLSQMLGASVDIGWFFDPWFAGNEGFWHLNPDYPEDEEKRVGFTDYTNPSSKSNDYAYTGICIDSIGPAGKVMSFRIGRQSFIIDNFISIRIGQGVSDLTPVDLDPNDDSFEFIIVADSTYIFDDIGNLINSSPFPRHGVFSEFDSKPIIYQHENKSILYMVTRNDTSSIYNVSSYEINAPGEISLVSEISTDFGTFSNVLSWGNELIYSGYYTTNTFKPCLFKFLLDPGNESSEYIELGSLIHKLAGDENNTFAITEGGTLLKIESVPFKIRAVGEIDSEPIGDLVVGYLNENIYPDVVVCSEDGISLFIDPEDSILSKMYFYSLKNYYPYPILSDIDGNSKVEVVVADSQHIYVFTDHLILESNFPVSIPFQYLDKYFYPYLLTTDINNDQILDILVNVKDAGVIAINKNGEFIKGFPKIFPDYIESSKMLLNSNKGVLQLAASKSTKSTGEKIPATRKINIIGSLISSDRISINAWTCLGGGADRSFFYSAKSEAPVTTTKSLLNKKETYNWPNPVKENTTRIRYFPNKSCDISIDIYDLAGDFIDSFKDSHPVVGDHNEIEWNVSNVESGVYFAVVEATSGSKTDSKIVKIMVIK